MLPLPSAIKHIVNACIGSQTQLVLPQRPDGKALPLCCEAQAPSNRSLPPWEEWVRNANSSRVQRVPLHPGRCTLAQIRSGSVQEAGKHPPSPQHGIRNYHTLLQ